MGVFRSLGRGLGKSWQVKRWLDYDHIKGNAGMIKSIWNQICTVKDDEGDQYKDFADVQTQLNVSDEDLKRMRKRFKLYSYIMIAIAVSFIVYAGSLFVMGSHLPALSCFVLSLLTLCFAFRESYNYYLLTTKRLKSTPRQWLKFIMQKGDH